jgi:hypothetical protein
MRHDRIEPFFHWVAQSPLVTRLAQEKARSNISDELQHFVAENNKSGKWAVTV